MNKDTTGSIYGAVNQTFTQGEKVMVRRLGDGLEYRAKIAGVSTDLGLFKSMIVEIIDPFSDDYEFTHTAVTEACIDKESW